MQSKNEFEELFSLRLHSSKENQMISKTDQRLAEGAWMALANQKISEHNPFQKSHEQNLALDLDKMRKDLEEAREEYKEEMTKQHELILALKLVKMRKDIEKAKVKLHDQNLALEKDLVEARKEITKLHKKTIWKKVKKWGRILEFKFLTQIYRYSYTF